MSSPIENFQYPERDTILRKLSALAEILKITVSAIKAKYL
jgi:hypothetical protein